MATVNFDDSTRTAFRLRIERSIKKSSSHSSTNCGPWLRRGPSSPTSRLTRPPVASISTRPDEQKAWKSRAAATTHSTTSSAARFDTSSKTAGRQVDRPGEREEGAPVRVTRAAPAPASDSPSRPERHTLARLWA